MSNEECLDKVLGLQKDLYVLSYKAKELGLCVMSQVLDQEAERLEDLIKMF